MVAIGSNDTDWTISSRGSEQQMEQQELEVIAEQADGKCPYLAGRPPHGTYKLWPSSINVCYGRPHGGKTYGHVSKETQGGRCFAGASAFCDCPDYQQALAVSLPAPEFGRAMKEDEELAPESPVRRVRKRRRKKHRRPVALSPLLGGLAFALLFVVTAVVVVQVLMKGP
jgi:hypothetical protein